MDDILVKSKTTRDHIEHLNKSTTFYASTR